MPCRCRDRCNADRDGCGADCCRPSRQSPNGSTAGRRDATIIAFSASVCVVDSGPVGPGLQILDCRRLAPLRSRPGVDAPFPAQPRKTLAIAEVLLGQCPRLGGRTNGASRLDRGARVTNFSQDASFIPSKGPNHRPVAQTPGLRADRSGPDSGVSRRNRAWRFVKCRSSGVVALKQDLLEDTGISVS